MVTSTISNSLPLFSFSLECAGLLIFQVQLSVSSQAGRSASDLPINSCYL